jgi:hypothetical protein
MQRRSLCNGIKSVLTTIPLWLALMMAGASCSHPPPPAASTQFLFVTLPEKHRVAVFAADATGDAKPLMTIQEAPSDTPIDAGVNSRGEIFVGNDNGTVNIYAGAHRNLERVRTLGGPNTRMVHPSSMAVDQSGAIYLTDLGNAPGQQQVIIMAAAQSGNVEPNRTIGGPHTGLTSPTGIAVSASEDVFVADHDSGEVLIFGPDARGDVPPAATLEGFKGPRRVFVDQDLNLFVTCDGDSSIAVLSLSGPRRWTRAATVTSPAMHDPIGIATDSAGRIATAVKGAVLFFAADANGTSTPILELQGPEPMNPSGLLIHN